MQCPYCNHEHPDNAKFCPITGKTLTSPPAGSKSFYMGIGVVSLLLVAVSLYMLLRENGSLSTGFPAAEAGSAAQPVGQMQMQAGDEQPLTDQKLTFTSFPTITHAPTSTSLPTQTTVPVPEPVESKINPADGAEIVLVPAGQFLMGSNQADDPYFWGAETPAHQVNLDSFWIYRTEVTQGMYQKCDEANACPAPVTIKDPVAQQYGNDRFRDYPVVMVTWQSAVAYCKWAGGRLPSEAEWEKAARGTDGRLFPWGNDPAADGLANYSASSPEPVGSYPYGASPYGVYDMAGNVLEWVNDYFQSGYYQTSPLDNPLGPASGNRHVIRGGAYNHPVVDGLRTVARASLKPADTKVSVGFRCAIDTPK